MYVFYEDISKDTGRVTTILFDDSLFDPLDKRQYFKLDTLPSPEEIVGKEPIMFIKKDEKEIYYEYENTPAIVDPVKEIKALQQENNTLRNEIEINQLALIELHSIILELKGGRNV
ncbi:hypothetical protein MKY85_06385 [Paenibacillus sp. FSL R5-0749]|uniref:hypothetical protein n=1 Tax=Paenibacillus sp. FSL R5-0749 TaxID=2921657 RepID=UPI00315A8BB5